MLLPRVLPCLLLRDRSLVKTIRFENPTYVGDPINAVNIFNEKGVDEIVLLDIEATKTQRPPNFALLEEIATECFIPLTYGGGVRSLDDMELLYGLGIEKISFNTALVERPDLVRAAATQFGSQSVVASIDVRRGRKGVRAVVRSATTQTDHEPQALAESAEQLGAGEILLTSADRDGTLDGYDVELIRSVTEAVTIPVVACGGAGSLADLRSALEAGASAAAAGSIFVFHGRNRAVLISFPGAQQLDEVTSTTRHAP